MKATTPDTFNGYPVIARGEPATPGSAEHTLIKGAISAWYAAGLMPDASMRVCHNTAKELEIELATGVSVAINTRI